MTPRSILGALAVALLAIATLTGHTPLGVLGGILLVTVAGNTHLDSPRHRARAVRRDGDLP